MAITKLTQPAPALTREELADISAATPSTFEGIAPLLRHSQASVTFSLTPACEGVTTGKGTLQITEGAVSFFDESTNTGLSIPYPHITLHAISRTSSAGGQPCIYCQLDSSEGLDPNEGDDDGESWELTLIPENGDNLDVIFETLSQCAALHPPPNNADNNTAAGGGSAGFFGLDPDSMVYADADGNVVGSDWADESDIPVMSAEEEAALDSSAGRAASAYLDTIFQRPTAPAAASGAVANGTAGEEPSSADEATA